MMEIKDVLDKTRANSLHQVGLTGRGTRVAILDSGIDSNHPVFENASIIDFNLTEETQDDGFGHGTHVASIFHSIAPDAIILNIKILDSEGETKMSTIMKGIDLARQEGADIINISGGQLFYGCPDDHPVAEMVKRCSEKGIIVVCACGNDGPKTSPFLPACAEGSVSVGSVNDRSRTNKFSSKGPSCKEKYPDCVSYGDKIMAAYPGNRYVELSGTSQAAPQVSGMFSLLRQATRVVFTREEIEELLSESCNWIESQDKNNYSGWGIIDMYKCHRALELKDDLY